METLQHRLKEESPVMSAAQGLTLEQRLLARDIELSAEIKSLAKEQADIRENLKSIYQETGERITLGPIEYAPRAQTRYEYSTEAFMKAFGKDANPYLAVDIAKVGKALEIGVLDLGLAKSCRTESVTLVHATRRMEEGK